MTIVDDIARGLFRLLPGNPILVRVVSTGGKRVRHLWARVIYLLALLGVFLVFGGLLFGAQSSLADQAKEATNTFAKVSFVQLLLMCFIAPVFCAGAITQEKDANTFHILLTTPLSNAQIVLGSLFSRIYFVWVLLLAGLPIFCITMIYGGVTTREIFESFGLAAATGLVTGSIAIMISFLKIGTRRTIFAFFVGVAVYLIGLGSLGLSAWGQLYEAPLSTITLSGSQYHMSWLAPVHPLLALMVVIGWTPAPDPAAVQHYGAVARFLLVYPQYGYMLITLLATAFMVLVSLMYVRRGAKEGERTWGRAIAERLLPQRVMGERRRKPRNVWRNPIAWREAATRASAGGRSILRLLFIIAGYAAGAALLISYQSGALGPMSPASAAGSMTTAAAIARAWLTPLVWIELAVILLVVTNTAATTLTREKESQTMELLLSTPLTSRYIIAGMLQGLVRLVVPLIAVPTLTVAAFATGDLLRWNTEPVTTFEAVFLLPLLLTAFAALAAMVGLHFSLLSKKTVQAVMVSTGIVLGAAGLLTACGYAMMGTTYSVAAVVLPFTPAWSIQGLLDPWLVANRAHSQGYGAAALTSMDIATFRTIRVIFSAIAAAAYLGITFALYNSMVRGFDMTVRRQSA